MRILFASGSLYGHVNTMLPLALAAQRAGYEVIFSTGADLVPHVRAHSLHAWATGLTHADAGGNRQPSWLAYFESTAKQRMPELLVRAMEWRPHLVIHEETELAGTAIAAATGARQLVHGLGLMPPPKTWAMFVDAIDRVSRPWVAVEAVAALAQATYLQICPPLFQGPFAHSWKRVLPLRPAAGLPRDGETLPPEVSALAGRPLVHLTLGTVFNEAREVLAQAVEGLRSLPVNLVVTVGPAVNPESFGPQPDNVVLARYVPHTLLLPHCKLVVSQGGAGILFSALSHGLPQLVLPQGADQFMNAEACRRAGAGLVLGPQEVTAQAINDAARQLLAQPSYTEQARVIAKQIAAMPGPADLLETMTGWRGAA